MVDFNIRVIVDPTSAARGNQTVRRDLRRTEVAADRVGAAIRRAFGFISGAFIIRGIGRSIDQFQTLENQIRAVSSSVREADTRLNRLFQIANRTRTPVNALGTLFQRAAIASNDLGASQDQLFTFVERVGQALAVQGTSTNTARGALIQLSQAVGSSIVRAEEFNSIQEGALPILQAVARGLDEAGGSVNRLRALVINGEVTNREFFEAFLQGSDQIAQQFQTTQATIGQASTLLGNAFSQTFGEASRATGALRSFVRLLQELASAVRSDLFRGAINVLFEGFSRISGALANTIAFLRDPTLQRFLNIGQVLTEGAPEDRDPDQRLPGLPPGGRGTTPLSPELQRELDTVRELSSELELQNQLIFAQLTGNQQRVDQLNVELAVQQAISEELRTARPDVAAAVQRQIEEQQQLNLALERQQRAQQELRQVTQDAFQTFVDGALRGRASIEDLFQSILSNLIRLQANRAFDLIFGDGNRAGGFTLGANQAGGTSFISGGQATSGFNPMSLLGFQGGGTIGGLTGDRNVLSVNGVAVARARRGEQFRVEPAGSGGGSVQIVNIENNTSARVSENRRTGPNGEQITDVVIGSREFRQAVAAEISAGPTSPNIR